MSLLADIQEAAVSTDGNVAQLLRQCKVLAARLNSKPLEDWLLLESNGYPEDATLPDYRYWSLQLKGHFFGSFGATIRNAVIPASCIPETLREAMTHFRCCNSIATVEAMLNNNGTEGTFQATRGDLFSILGNRVYEEFECAQVWGEFGKARFVEILNTVRNRILDFTLAIWKENPEAGEASSTAVPISPQQVTHIFNTTVHGGAANIVSESHASPINCTIQMNDFEGLKRYLELQSVPKTDIEALRTALSHDPRPETPNKFGPQVSQWVGKMMDKAATGLWEVGLSVAGTILSTALCKYYGM